MNEVRPSCPRYGLKLTAVGDSCPCCQAGAVKKDMGQYAMGCVGFIVLANVLSWVLISLITGQIK